MLFVRFIIAFIVVFSSAQIALAQPEKCTKRDERFRIGVLYQSSDARKRLLDGVEEALISYKPKNTSVCIKDMPYTGANEGLAKLRDSIKAESVDLIIGPTESDVFVRAYDERETLGAHMVPVISPLITADVGIDEKGWFFRTNVGIGKRASVTFDYLNKHWIKTFSIVYADTEFGRRGEKAFREEVKREFGATDSYIAEAYKPPPQVEVRTALDKVIRFRPEAVGVFGEREDIPVVIRELERMIQASPPYKPLIFTLIDISQIRDEVSDIRFVATTKPEFLPLEGGDGSDYDDVKGLSYDTIAYVTYCLNKLPPMKTFDSRRAFRERFRNEFSAVMNGGSRLAGLKTDMKLIKQINNGILGVYHISGGKIQREDIHKSISPWTLLTDKLHLIESRFGIYPLLAMLVLLAVIAFNVVWDLFRWYEGPPWKIIKNWRTGVVILVQCLLGTGAFIYLAEKGEVRYDSIMAAAVIGFAPSQFLRLKFFETRSGTNVGVVAIYDRLLSWFNDGFMVKKYNDLETKMRYLAHYNTISGMKTELDRLYGHNRSGTQAQRLKDGLKRQLDNATNPWEKRLILAGELLRRFKLDELKERRLLPKNVNKDEDFIGPFQTINDSRQYILSSGQGHSKLDKVLEDELKDCSDRIKHFYERKVREEEWEDDIVYSKVRFLVLQFRYSKKQLQDAGLLDKDKEAPEKGMPRKHNTT